MDIHIQRLIILEVLLLFKIVEFYIGSKELALDMFTTGIMEDGFLNGSKDISGIVTGVLGTQTEFIKNICI